MKVAAYHPRELLAAAAVLLALSSLAAFSLWGMAPSSTKPKAAPAVTTPAVPSREREGGSD